MYMTPPGFVLLSFSIWLLWQASKTARFSLNQIVLDKESRRLRRKAEFMGVVDAEADKFLSDARNKIYKAGMFILASFGAMFCVFFFTIKTPGSVKPSSAWSVALLVLVYFVYAFVFQFVIPLLDLEELESGQKNLLDLDD